MTTKLEDLIKKAYTAFNGRDIDKALTTFHPNVEWPKAFEGGYVSGHEEVKAYWTRQWTEINPIVEPITINEREHSKYEVIVHQLVKYLEGKILFDGVIKHIFTIQDNLLAKMDIELE
jgi:hypothetical protein